MHDDTALALELANFILFIWIGILDRKGKGRRGRGGGRRQKEKGRKGKKKSKNEKENKRRQKETHEPDLDRWSFHLSNCCFIPNAHNGLS